MRRALSPTTASAYLAEIAPKLKSMKRHEWHERTADGNVQYYRASHHGDRWTLQSTLKTDADWHTHEPIGLDEWRRLRDVLVRKYRRRRGAWKEIEAIDRRIEKLEASSDASRNPSDDGA